MPIVIKIAQSSNELKETLNFRYKVTKESKSKPVGLFERSLKICDHFDSYPDTVNSVAYVEGDCVANLRAIKYNPDECANNSEYDFSGSFDQLKSNIFLIDIVTISKDFKKLDLLFTEMLKSLLSYLYVHGGKYLFFYSPAEYKEKLKNLGFSSLQAEMSDSKVRENAFGPFVIDLESYNKKNLEKVLDKEILKFSDVFYRTIFFAGEIIVLEGEKGTSAYLVETGEVEIVTIKNEKLISLGVLREGSLIGEIAMATGDRRTASIIAKTMTSCMAFDRAEFVKNMYENPSKSLDVLKIFSKRLNSANQRMATIQRSSVGE
jgi:hypothetical protein